MGHTGLSRMNLGRIIVPQVFNGCTCHTSKLLKQKNGENSLLGSQEIKNHILSGCQGSFT